MVKNKLLIAFGFIVIALLGYFGYKTIEWLIVAVKDVNPSVGAAIIVSAATIISSVFIASYNSRKAKEKVAFEAHRGKKAEIYNEFMEVILQLIRNIKSKKEGDDVLPENIEEFFLNFIAKITVYGGPGVVNAYSKWQSAPVSNDESKEKKLLLVDAIFREMRRDIGESNKGIGTNELLGLYIIGGESAITKANNKTINSTS